MCLIMSKYSRPFIATKDITVYKAFSLGNSDLFVRSPYRDFLYTIGKKYETEITIFNGFKESFDGIDSSYAAGKWGDKWEKHVKSASTGFHSVKTLKRLDKWYYRTYVIHECIIPKGATYYVGVTDLVVSNQIIVSKRI